MKFVGIGIAAVLLIASAFFAFTFLKNSDPLMADEEIGKWVQMCGSDSSCQKNVKKHYATCVNSLSYEKPITQGDSKAAMDKLKSDMAEYSMLINAEIEACLSDKTGNEFAFN